MNLRQKKKLFKKITGKNPPKQTRLSGREYNEVAGIGKKKYIEPEIKAEYNNVFEEKIMRRLGIKVPDEVMERVEKMHTSLIHEMLTRVDRKIDYMKRTVNVTRLSEILTHNRKTRRRR